jgi:hypothetical protein
MPARGTLGMRMSRMRVDGLLNNTDYWRAIETEEAKNLRYSLPGEAYITGTGWALALQTQVPLKILLASHIRVAWDMKCYFSPGYLLTVKVVVDGATQTTQQTNVGYYLHSWFDAVVGPGSIVQLYGKMDTLFVDGSIINRKVYAMYEGIVETVGPAWT